MDISLDDIFVIGDGHAVCEDYSWSGMIQGKYPCAIISDGCSASKYTDIGSRILVRSLISALQIVYLTNDMNNIGYMYQGVEHYLDLKITKMRDAMELPVEALDATIRMALIIEDKLFLFNYGDGFTVLRNHTTGESYKRYVKYPFNAPYYFNYTTHDALKERYIQCYDGQIIDDSGDEFTVREHVELDGLRWEVIPFDSFSDGDWTVSVMSDGIETFQDIDPISEDIIIDEMLSFKNFRGEFVQRKIRKFLHQKAKSNTKHYDDVSVASIKFTIGGDDE